MSIKFSLILFAVISFVACANTIEPNNPPKNAEAMHSFLEIGGAKLEILFSSDIPETKKSEFLAWITRSAKTVSRYYDRFPVKHAGITIIGVDEPGVKTGKAMQGTQAPQILVWVGTQTSSETLESDWVMVHEMIHLGTATLQRKHRWLEEGLSVYVESIARAQNGELEPEHIWRQFAKRMPHGQLKSADEGLDFTQRWGRTYWGGAVFFLLADIEIRNATNNSQNLADALKNVQAKGLTMNKNIDIETLISTMDEALPSPIIGALYKQYARQATPFPLDEMWQKLGVNPDTTKVFDNSAPLACIRESITNTHASRC